MYVMYKITYEINTTFSKQERNDLTQLQMILELAANSTIRHISIIQSALNVLEMSRFGYYKPVDSMSFCSHQIKKNASNTNEKSWKK